MNTLNGLPKSAGLAKRWRSILAIRDDHYRAPDGIIHNNGRVIFKRLDFLQRVRERARDITHGRRGLLFLRHGHIDFFRCALYSFKQKWIPGILGDPKDYEPLAQSRTA